MIHINKSSDKQFFVTVVAGNGETLSTSETFNKKQNAWKNIAAQSTEFSKVKIRVMDSSLSKPVTYLFDTVFLTRQKIK